MLASSNGKVGGDDGNDGITGNFTAIYDNSGFNNYSYEASGGIGGSGGKGGYIDT